MTFLAPLMLIGLLATLIPPIIHLLNRREAKPTPFPAMEFLRRAHRRTARRLKMKQWLLLFLRIALFALLVIALAQPLWRPSSSASLTDTSVASGGMSGSHVVVIDQSYPMGYQVDQSGRSLIDLAKSHALRAISETSGPMSVIRVGEIVSPVTGDVTADHQLLSDAVKSLKVTDAVGDLTEGINLAYRILKERPRDEGTQITVLSTPSRYRSNLPPAPPGMDTTIVALVDLSTELKAGLNENSSEQTDLPQLSQSARARLDNHAITQVTLSPAPQMGEDQWRVEVTIANYSDEAMVLWPIWVEVEGDIRVRGFVSLKPGESGVKRLYFRGKSTDEEEDARPSQPALSALKGWVKLAPDALSTDDRYPFWIEPAPPSRLFVLNGDPRPTPQDDELYYLERALTPKVLGRGRVKVVSRPTRDGELAEGSLEGVDLIIVANVPRPTFELGEQLLTHLERGGGVWFAPGARVDPASWNQAFGSILPRPLRGPRRAGDAAAALDTRRAARLSEFQAKHPIFAPFEDPQRSSLALAQLMSYMLFDPLPTPRSEVIASLSEGSPFMVTREVGEGRVLLWAGPLDREWGDLVLRPDFIPLVGETLRYLTRESSGSLLSVSLGSTLRLELNGAGPFTSLSPQGIRVVMGRDRASSQDTQNQGRRGDGWQLDRVREVGHHKVITPSGSEADQLQAGEADNEGELIARRYVVSLDPRLSNLRGGNDAQSEEKEQSKSDTMGALGQRRELWHIGLVGLFVFMLFEGVTLYQRREDPLT